MMVQDDKKQPTYDLVDTAELVLYKSKSSKFREEVRTIIQELRTLPSGKSVRRKWTEPSEQKGFAASLGTQLDRLGIRNDFVIVAPKQAVDNYFLVFVGRKSDIEED